MIDKIYIFIGILFFIAMIACGVLYKKRHKKGRTTSERHNSSTCNVTGNNLHQKSYRKKQLLTATEKYIYSKIQLALQGKNILLIPQINLASVITKEKEFRTQWQNELYRNIDFGIFTKDFDVLLLIELNDYTHRRNDRIGRDNKVKEICALAGIRLITLWADKPNTVEYIKSKIEEMLSK